MKQQGTTIQRGKFQNFRTLEMQIFDMKNSKNTRVFIIQSQQQQSWSMNQAFRNNKQLSSPLFFSRPTATTRERKKAFQEEKDEEKKKLLP